MPTLAITTKPGKKYRSLKRPRVYEALRRQGHSKQSAARISNAQAHKAYTLAQLEAFVSSPHYDSVTAGLIACGIPALKAAGAPGELISPGVRRIHGNLCNVHGRYGPCDKALSGKKPPKPRKGRAPAKPKQTPAQRAAARTQQRDQNTADVAKRMAETDTGLGPSGSRALSAFAQGQQPDTAIGDAFVKGGLAERAQDGTYRMTPTGRAVVSAMAAGDYQRAVDAISRGADASGKRTERQTAAQARQAAAQQRQQDVAARRTAAQVKRETAARQRAEAAKKPAKAGAGKKPEKVPTERPRTPAKAPARRALPGTAASSGSSAAPAKPKPPAPPKPVAPPKPEKAPPAPAKQVAPALTEAAQQLSDGKELADDDAQALIRNGLARLVKGELVLTAAGQRLTMKSFRVFKDASGRHRWVAQSSTAFQDRDKEIVSTKALADDCRWADTHDNAYGPLRWWHTPGLDLGDCDFNAMHGRVLIESGTFRSAAIAQKVAAAASGLEISLGFIHLPSEPDASGVFHHIRRFERSLVPRGKASNRFTAFAVKETPMFDPTKVAALKQLGFSDDDIAGLQTQAEATEKAATDQGVAYKADEPTPPEEITIGGVVYTVKAFPPKADDAPATEDVIEQDAFGDMPAEEEVVDENALTLSAGDLAAIQGMIAQVMGALELEKKVAGHVQGLMAPYQATKDAEAAETKEQIAALANATKALDAKVAELTGDQPAAPYRASTAKDNVLTDAKLLAAIKDADPNANDPWADIKLGLGISRPQ